LSSFHGAISIGPPNAKILSGLFTPDTQFGWFEILRFALSEDCPRNSESRVISVALKLLRKVAVVKGVISYADTAAEHVGTIYKACGFQSFGLTAPKTDFYVGDEIQWRGSTKELDGEWRPRSQKWLFVKRFA
jgi:hypothetical protein